MKRFNSFKNVLTEAKLGDCFEVSGRMMMKIPDEMEKAGMKCVHAFVYGEGKLKGRRFEHAFNKLGDVIFDNSNGKTVTMRKEAYFKQAGINLKEKGAYVEYDKEKTMVNMLKYKHWGPWDLNSSLVEEIPDDKKEIGKKKLRISPKILQTIKDKINGQV